MVRTSIIFVMLLASQVFSQKADTLKKYPTVPIPSKINFINDEEIEIRFYLVKKYEPGDCFGMPGPKFYQRPVDGELLLKLKQLAPGKSDRELEELAHTMARISLHKQALGKYEFEFRDGRCCSIIHYRGTLEKNGNDIKEQVVEKRLESVPC